MMPNLPPKRPNKTKINFHWTCGYVYGLMVVNIVMIQILNIKEITMARIRTIAEACNMIKQEDNGTSLSEFLIRNCLQKKLGQL